VQAGFSAPSERFQLTLPDGCIAPDVRVTADASLAFSCSATRTTVRTRLGAVSPLSYRPPAFWHQPRRAPPASARRRPWLQRCGVTEDAEHHDEPRVLDGRALVTRT